MTDSNVRIQSVYMQSIPCYSEGEIRRWLDLGTLNNHLATSKSVDIAHIGNMCRLIEIIPPVPLNLPPVDRSVGFTLSIVVRGLPKDDRIISCNEFFSLTPNSLPSWARPVGGSPYPTASSNPTQGIFSINFPPSCRNSSYMFMFESHCYCACVLEVNVSSITTTDPICDHPHYALPSSKTLQFNTPIPIDTVSGITQIFQIRKLNLSMAGFVAVMNPGKCFRLEELYEDHAFLYIAIRATPRAAKNYHSRVDVVMDESCRIAFPIEADAYNPLDEVGTMDFPSEAQQSEIKNAFYERVEIRPATLSIIDGRETTIEITNTESKVYISYHFPENPIFNIRPCQGTIGPKEVAVLSVQLKESIYGASGNLIVPCSVQLTNEPTQPQVKWIEVQLFNSTVLNRAMTTDCILSELRLT